MSTLVTSYCRVCPALCGILVEVDDDGRSVLAVKGDRDHPLSRGYTCPKGRALPEEVHSPDRLTGALRRSGDAWEPVSTDDAIAEIGTRLAAIVDEHGPRAVALYVGTRGYEVLQLAGAQAWLNGIGSPNFFSTYTIDQPGKDLARARHGSWPAGFHDVETSDVVMLVGTNPMVSAVTPYIAMPMTNLRMEIKRLRARGFRLIVVDPRRTETAAIADIHLRPRPGTDAVVLAGMVRVIIGEERHDCAFVDAYTRGFDELHGVVEPFTSELVERVSGVPAAELVAAAHAFAHGPRGCAVGGTGINMSPHPTLNEYLLLCLNTLCGRYRRAGEQISNPGALTPGRSLSEGPRGPARSPAKATRSHACAGCAPCTTRCRLQRCPTRSSPLVSAKFAALVVSGGNPLTALPDRAKTRRAFESLELLVTLDVRLAHTAAMSDYVIACPMSLEKADATVASDLRYPVPFAQYTEPVVTPGPGQVEEWDFFYRLAKVMGTPWDFGGRVGMPIPLDVADEDAGDADPTAGDLWSRVCAGGTVTLDEVRAHPHGLLVEMPPRFVEPLDRPVRDEDRLELADTEMMAELGTVAAERPHDGSWPFLLTSRRMWEYYNSWGQDIPSIRRRHGANPAFMHPDDLAGLGLHDGDVAVIESEHGAVEAVVRAAPDVSRATVSMAHCWGADNATADVHLVGSSTNALISNEEHVADEVGMARQSAVPVRVRPLRARRSLALRAEALGVESGAEPEVAEVRVELRRSIDRHEHVVGQHHAGKVRGEVLG